LCAGDRLGAQVTGTWASLGFGMERMDRRDHRISPAKYSGSAIAWRWGVERRTARFAYGLEGEIGGGDLESQLTGGQEHVVRFGSNVWWQYCLRPSLCGGIDVAGRLEEAEHSYPHTVFTESFDVAVVTLSPRVTWTPRWRGHGIRVDGFVAGISQVNHEYSRSKAGATKDGYALPTTWSSGSVEVSRLFRERARVSWRLAARSTAWSHRVEDGAASVGTQLSLAGRLRLGRIR
jgi:hypothetical protein